MLSFANVYFLESGLFNGLRPIQIKKFVWYLLSRCPPSGVCDHPRDLALPNTREFERTGILVVAALGACEGKRHLAHGEVDGCLGAFGFGIEQPCGLFERSQVHSCGVDPRFIGCDRSCDLIPFAAQGGGDVHLMKVEQNRNYVNANSDLSALYLLPKPRKRPSEYPFRKPSGSL
jgi:hypothetical protein